jgi:hypothetical protein
MKGMEFTCLLVSRRNLTKASRTTAVWSSILRGSGGVFANAKDPEGKEEQVGSLAINSTLLSTTFLLLLSVLLSLFLEYGHDIRYFQDSLSTVTSHSSFKGSAVESRIPEEP